MGDMDAVLTWDGMGLLASDIFLVPVLFVALAPALALVNHIPAAFIGHPRSSDAAGGTISLIGKHGPSSQHCVIATDYYYRTVCRALGRQY